MTPLAQKLKTQIVASGPISFSEYMAACLFDPEWGYYTNLKAIGREGDFVTAPECGPYLAQAIAHCVKDKLQQLNNPVILELGGGTGQLAFDLLSALDMQVRYLILDKSPSLKALQQEKLKGFQVEWCERIEVQDLEGLILANEFFDALPVERFVESEAGAVLTHVDYQNAEFVETAKGERFEKCLILKEVLQPILAAFKHGIALVIDYGAERVTRSTLTAYHQHQIVSVFDRPGECDITAHVDFTDLAEAFLLKDWQVEFLKPQNQFLLEQGALPAAGIDPEHYALKRLLDPRLMGELFKVLFMSKAPT